jgi:hypothetical protein
MAIPYLFVDDPDERRHRERLASAVNALIAGKLDVVGSFTLAANVTSTTVSDNKFESNMAVVWVPTTANAAGAVGGLYLSGRSQGSFTLTHANTATTDRTFLYVRLG